MKRTKKIYLLFIIILGSLGVAKIVEYDVDRNGSCLNISDKTFKFLIRELVYENYIYKKSVKTFEDQTIIYVLGGGQDSLNTRYRKASILYHQGLSNKILILSRVGTTEYNLNVGRNFTNDEWSVRELEKFNVRKEDIEVVRIRPGLFGTANEAKYLMRIVQEKNINRLILVTSSYHTKRAFTAFSHFATDRHLELFIYGSEDNAGLRVLLQEYTKLFLYEKIVLPGYGMVGQDRNNNSAENRGNNVGK